LIYIGYISQTCTPLPSHFSGKPLRAIGQVWNSVKAIISQGRRMLTVPTYDYTSWNSKCSDLQFRTALNRWNGKWSDSTQNGMQDRSYNETHIELTSRRLNDGETFLILGSSVFVSVGLCIDSCELESNYEIRGYYDCVGFWGNGTLMYAADGSSVEYSLYAVNDPSNVQGFTYDKGHNCITHKDSINGNCAALPSHFDGKPVRAIAEVWNNTFADLVGISKSTAKVSSISFLNFH